MKSKTVVFMAIQRELLPVKSIIDKLEHQLILSAPETEYSRHMSY